MPHIHELIDFTVTPVVVHPDRAKVLLVNHPKYGKWMSIGGHIELDENPDQALAREIEEEAGLEVEYLSPEADQKGEDWEVLRRPNSVDIHDANPPHRHIGLVYFCIAKSENFKKSDEHQDMRWFDLEEIETGSYDITELSRYYAKLAIEEASK